MTFPITAYIEAALELAHYDKLEDGSFAGEIPKLKVEGRVLLLKRDIDAFIARNAGRAR